MKIARLLGLLTLPLLLASCLFSPGKFTSDMVVQANGAFSFRYKGEIVFVSLMQMMNKDGGSDGGMCAGPLPGAQGMEESPTAVDDAVFDTLDTATTAAPDSDYGMADRTPRTSEIKPVDPDAGGMEDVTTSLPPEAVEAAAERPCTADEIAARTAEKAERQTRDTEEAERFQQMIGFNPKDEASMQAFAAQMMKQKGWRSVAYRGNGVFDVDYEIAGTLDRDFLFPVYPDASVVYPMVLVRRRADGSVQVTAPSFGNNAGNPLAAMALMGGVGGPGTEKAPPSLADGGFTLRTDAAILTNNTEDGAAPVGAMQQLYWPVNPRTTKIPEALLRLTR